MTVVSKPYYDRIATKADFPTGFQRIAFRLPNGKRVSLHQWKVSLGMTTIGISSIDGRNRE